jgi:hypothetical protein
MSESIKSGQHYNIINEDNGLAFDLWHNGHTSVVGLGYKFHGEGGQQVSRLPTSIARPSYNRDTVQWIIERQNDVQWSIRSVMYQEYIGFENAPKDGTLLIGLDKPHLWDIEIQPDSEDDDNTRVRYVLSRTLLSLAIVAPDIEPFFTGFGSVALISSLSTPKIDRILLSFDCGRLGME